MEEHARISVVIARHSLRATVVIGFLGLVATVFSADIREWAISVVKGSAGTPSAAIPLTSGAPAPPPAAAAPALRLSNPRVVGDGRGGAAAQALLDLYNPQATTQHFFIRNVQLVLDPNPDGLRFTAPPPDAQYCGSNFAHCRDTLGKVPQALAPGEARTLAIPVQVAPVLAGRRIETLRPAAMVELMLADKPVFLNAP